MHSSPIDLLARPPGQPKTAPSDSDSDGRFSDLLRPPADDAAAPSPDRPDEAAATPVQDESAQGNPAATVDTELPEQAAIGNTKDGLGQGPEAFIEALAIIPEAITHGSTPAVGLSTQMSVETAIASAAAHTLQMPGTAVPSSRAPTDGLIPTAAPRTGPAQPAAGTPLQPTGAALLPTSQVNPGNAAAAAPPPTAMATATHPKPEGSDTVAIPKPPMAVVSETATAMTNAGSDVKAAAAAGAQATQASITQSVLAGTASPAASAGPAASTKPTASPRFTADARAQGPMSEATESPDQAEEFDLRTVLASTNSAGKTAGTPANGQGAPATPTPAGGKPLPMTTPEAMRPEVTVSDRPLATAQAEPVGATAPGPSTRPILDPAAMVQTSNGNAAPPPATDQVVLQLRKVVATGVDRMTVQLKPATLGRVDVQMEVGHDGRVQAVISAERPETLHLLQRDARALTTALADAGLQADSGSLSFNLRGQTGDQAGGNDHLYADDPTSPGDADAEDGGDALAPITLTLGDGRVDIKV